MPIDTESLRKIEKAKGNADVDLELAGKARERMAKELEAWRRIKALVEAPGWKDVQEMYAYHKDLIGLKLSGEKHISASKLIELRGRLQILSDILGLDAQAAVEVNSLQQNLLALDKKMTEAKDSQSVGWVSKLFKRK